MSRYKEAGVDISGASKNVEEIGRLARRTHGPEVMSGLGGFSGLFHAGSLGMGDMVLSAGADGVGTKVLIAQAMGIHNTVGIDLVAMNADDVVTSGARPIFFLDYIAVGRLNPKTVLEIVEGVAEGCLRAGCALLGGETAQMPDIYGDDEYDLAGFCVGAVDRNRIIDGSRIEKGDILIGLASSGLHSNGYSLVRKVLLKDAGLKLTDHIDDLGKTLGEELLEPTMIYAPSVLSIAQKVDLKGIAHVTGGGIPGNVPRVFPKGLTMRVSWDWERPAIFHLVQKAGRIDEEEMRQVFNLGVGMVLVVDPDDYDSVIAESRRLDIRAFQVGEVTTE